MIGQAFEMVGREAGFEDDDMREMSAQLGVTIDEATVRAEAGEDRPEPDEARTPDRRPGRHRRPCLRCTREHSVARFPSSLPSERGCR